MVETPQVLPSDRDRLFEYIQGKGVEFETVYTYEELETFLGKPRGVVRNLIRSLNNRLLGVSNRYLKSKPNVGWYVINAGDHADVAADYAQKANRALTRAFKTVAGADVSVMTPAQRDRNDLAVSGYRALQRKVMEDSRRIQRLEQVQAVHVQVTKTHETRLEQIEREQREFQSNIARQIEELKRQQAAS